MVIALVISPCGVPQGGLLFDAVNTEVTRLDKSYILRSRWELSSSEMTMARILKCRSLILYLHR